MEKWKTVPLLPKYQVSTKGRVRNKKTKQIRITTIDKTGCNTLKVFYPSGKRKWVRVYIMIAMAFHNHVPCGSEIIVDHKDNDRLNDKPNNLQLITTRENCSKDRKDKTSNFTGVHYNQYSKAFRASIRINQIKIHLGTFHDDSIAHQHYLLALNNLKKFKGGRLAFKQLISSLYVK